MSAFDNPLPSGWHALRVLRMGLILLPVLATVIFGIVDWRRVRAEAHDEAVANVALVREYTLRLVEAQEVLLRSAGRAVAELQDMPQRDVRAHRFLASLDEGMSEVVRLALIAPDGDFLLTSSQFPARGNVGHREYVTAALAGADPFIDRLVVQPENRDVLIISRASSAAAASGVWNSALDAEVVTNFLRQVSPNTRNAASLLREDGKVLARHVDVPEPVILGPDHPAMQGIALSDSGSYTVKAVSDGISRFYAYERVGDLPLFAVAGVARSGVFWTWFWQTALFSSVLFALAFAAFQLVKVAELGRVAELERLQGAFDRDLRQSAEKTAALRETMLRELHHRVKNSLGMISGLIMLERRRQGGPDLEAVNARVFAIARIHDLLHRSSDGHRIDLFALIRDICASDAVVPPERGVAIECVGSSTMVEERLASPIALCLIELVTNAEKHAFDELHGRIRVTLETEGATARLIVEDDGRGMPANETRRSGLRIVDAMVLQIEGRMEVESGAGGTRTTIAFPLVP